MELKKERSVYEYPFRVALLGKEGSNAGFVAHFDDLEEAQKSAEERNARAEAMGIAARYVTVPTPKK